MVVVVARTQHHPMLAEGYWPKITIARDVFDRENRHCHSSITHMSITRALSGQIMPVLGNGTETNELIEIGEPPVN